MFGGDPFGGGDPFDDPFFTGGGSASRREGRGRDPFDAMRQMMGGGGLLGGGFGEDFGRMGGGGNSSFTMMSSSTTVSADGRSRTVTETAQRHGAGPVVGERREQRLDVRPLRSREAVFGVLELVCELLEREGVFARSLAHGLAHLRFVLLHLGRHRKLVFAIG